MIPKKMPVKDAHIVKIAVEYENHLAQLINLDQRQPLTGKLLITFYFKCFYNYNIFLFY